MVRAILEEKKTQTRRLVKPQPPESANVLVECSHSKRIGQWWSGNQSEPVSSGCVRDFTHTTNVALNTTWKCPYGLKGDQLWVKETWQSGDVALNDPRGAVYRATDPDWEAMQGWAWKPSIFMPRFASRITLEVTNIRAQRLQDISAEDCIAEGIPYEEHKCGCEACSRTSQICPATSSSLILAYANLWESINGKRSWERNPWVWRIEFKLLANQRAA